MMENNSFESTELLKSIGRLEKKIALWKNRKDVNQQKKGWFTSFFTRFFG